MKQSFQRHRRVLVFLFASMLALSETTVAAGVLEGEALIEALRGGGYNIYYRHAQTNWNQSDRIERQGDWTSCDPDRVRQLSDQGRHSAREVGIAMRALGIPVGRVLSSPYCRSVETVELMQIGPVQTTLDVLNLRAAGYAGGREAVIGTARRLLGSMPAEGMNTVISAHGNVARAATGVYPGEAEALVFKPLGNAEFEFTGRLTPAQWRELAEIAKD